MHDLSFIWRTLQLKARPNLHQLDALGTGLLVHVVTEADKIVCVCKGHDTFAVLLGNGEEELEDALDAVSEF